MTCTRSALHVFVAVCMAGVAPTQQQQGAGRERIVSRSPLFPMRTARPNNWSKLSGMRVGLCCVINAMRTTSCP